MKSENKMPLLNLRESLGVLKKIFPLFHFSPLSQLVMMSRQSFCPDSNTEQQPGILPFY